MTSRFLTFAGNLSPLLRAGIIAGVVLSAAVYPIAAVSGFGLKAGADRISAMPDDLGQVRPAEATYVYASDGETLITKFYEEYRKFVPITEMSPYIQQAIVASEDSRFYQHNGVDSKSVARAFVANTQAGGVEQGASTLTMQYVRMALRDSAQTPAEVMAATEQTAVRKLREARMAVEVEKQLSKAEILERYLNHAYFGHRAYGIFSAAEIFFSKRPSELDVAEAALLAGLVQAPSAYDPASQDQQAATDRRNWVIDRMRELGYVSPTRAEEAKAQPIELDLTDPVNDCVSVPEDTNDWGFFCGMFRNWWLSQPAFGEDPLERETKLRRGGYTIVTSLDPEVQATAQHNVRTKEPIGSPFAHGTVVVEPGTGLVKAMALNRVFSLDQSENGPHSNLAASGPSTYPNTVSPMLGGGGLPGYQAGSTFKWFTLLAALEAGMPLSTSIYSPQRYVSTYPAAPGGPASCGNRWCPSNASGAMTGTRTMWSGFGQSVNTFFVQLQERVGAEAVVRMAEELGLTWRTEVDQAMASEQRADGWGSFTLGVADTSPLEMAGAYAVGAADGIFCEPLPVTSIKKPNGEELTYRNAQGKVVEVAAPRCHRAVSEAAARAATDAARCVTGYGAARGSCGGWSTADDVYGIVGRPVAGKTGTTDSDRTAWFVGFTPELAAASFIADPDNPSHAVGVGNSSKPIKAVAQTLHDALADEPVSDFPPPPPTIVG